MKTPPSEGGEALKINLRKFSLRASGGYRGRSGSEEFVVDLLGCFGWDGVPDGAQARHLVSVVEKGKRSKRKVDLLWSERGVMVEVVKREVMLDYAWKELLRVCLQLDRVPQYVLLTNLREVHLYDLASDRETPRLTMALDELAKYSEAFPFLRQDWVPGTLPQIINVDRVSKEVADLVGKLYRSLKASSPDRPDAVIRFTLQCIISMFAEDIGLLPQEYFTTLLYEGAANGDAAERLAGLFKEMSTKKLANRTIAYFNGGLFSEPVTVPLGKEQLRALTKAAEANWTHVDPHIFGSVFQSIMDDDERHASGAHYTARDDIMRVVGPTIVEPWRSSIHGATTLAQLEDLLAELGTYRVLDPACGSGNFLYVAFRELHRLETELLGRMHEEYASVQKQRRGWASVIRTTSFFGIDINPFAVELAKTTLNIAKKIAFEERKEKVAALYGQLEMEVDMSLPLDNLDTNILCTDALFSEWPEVDAIVGNPPFLGDRKIRRELGGAYVERLKHATGVSGVLDLCCYWYRRAHEHLPAGGRAGLISTSGIRVGKARESALDHIVSNGATIVNAVSSRPWPGDAQLSVSMVNWVNGQVFGPHELIVAGRVHRRATIHTHLRLHADVSEAKKIKANAGGSAMGVIFGSDEFKVTGDLLRSLMTDQKRRGVIRPVASGTPILTGRLAEAPEYCVDLTAASTETDAKKLGGDAFDHLRRHVFPMVSQRAADENSTHHYERWLRAWWQPREPSAKFFSGVRKIKRFIACSNPQQRPVFVFLSSAFVPTNSLQVFAFEDDYTFGVIQSLPHWLWVRVMGGRVTERMRYTGNVWRTFPWPQEVTEAHVANVASAARSLRAARATLMASNGWSLRSLYQAAEVDGPHPLKDAQTVLDGAVSAAYEMPAGKEVTEFLLELNLCLAEDEADDRPVQGPGLPARLDPKDPRWSSDDCIKPPPLG